MTRLASVLLAATLGATCANAGELDRWPPSQFGSFSHELAPIEGDPWADDGSTAPAPDDAYVFADVTHASGLSRDAVAVAVRADIERLALSRRNAGVAENRSPKGRVALAFGRFTPVGLDGGGYTSIEGANGYRGPSALAAASTLEQTRVAMTLLDR